MCIIQLHHDKRLAYASMKTLPALSKKELDASLTTPLITFRSTGKLKPKTIYRKLNACTRLPDLPAGDLTFCGIESDSPLAPLILWDAAHRLEIGATITLYDCVETSYLEREYYKESFQIISRDSLHISLRKIACLPAELNRGLDRWSFCIPTGPGDATGLNVVVKRILELEIPEKEILLCGRPGENFLYWDHVRIVGEDIPAPPIWITRKKNILAKEARFENLCILHDRVFLPVNFMSAIKQFGDDFPFVGFQSLWFDDRLNLSPVRYSDYNSVIEKRDTTTVSINKNGYISAYTPNLFTEIEKQNFIYENPLRYDPASYLTGSLYIVKRAVWLKVPQNEALYWNEFEDIEQGRCSEICGIPHRIIQGAFTQSLFARPTVYSAGYTTYLSASGLSRLVRKVLPLPTLLRKPLIKLKEKEANERLAKFANKYCPQSLGKVSQHIDYISKVLIIIYASQFKLQRHAIRTFITDVEKYILCDEESFSTKENLVNQFIIHRANGKINLGYRFEALLRQFSLRPRGRRFYQSISEYFPKRGWAIKLGSFISAIRLNALNGNFFYHPDGWRGYYKAILSSTPFIDYTEGS